MTLFSRLLLAGAAGLLAGWLLARAPITAQEPAARAKTPTYHVLAADAGNGAEFLRYRPDTGEAWLSKNLAWQKVVDADLLPAGEYEVQMVGLPAVNSVEVTRLDRGTGRGWVMRNMKWIEITEPR